jgi:hypothetical protein
MAYWALVESYRTARGPRQRVVAYLGELNERGRVGVKRAAESASTQQADLFQPSTIPEWVEVDIGGVRVERSRQFGGYLAWISTSRSVRSSSAVGRVVAARAGGSWLECDGPGSGAGAADGCPL